MNTKNDEFLIPRVKVSYLKITDSLHPLYEGLNFIGRRKGATVIIENENVSQYQAVITITDNKHFISDIGSSNGTFLDKDKLQPLLLYELSEGSIIHFACITAIYVKTPSNSQAAHVLRKTTQILSETFFTSSTQQLEVENVEAVFNNCFDDDYDFNEIPTTQNVSSVVSINDMPTQIFSSSEFEAIEKCTPSKTPLLTIHDISTPISNTPCSIHEMPTQLIINEASFEKEIKTTATDIHDLQTQIIDFRSRSNLTASKENKKIDIHELSTQINSADDISTQKPQDEQIEILCSVQNGNEGFSIEKKQEQTNLVHSDKSEDILCQPSTSKCFDTNADVIIATNDNCVIGSPEPECSVVDISDDIIDDSLVENLTENGEKQEYLSLKSISKLTNSEPSQLPLQSSQPVGFSANKKKSQPIVYDSSSSEKCSSAHSEDEVIAGHTKNCLRIDSDTDIEDLPAASNSEIKNTKIDKLDDSGSATDIENNLTDIETVTTKKVVRRRKTGRKIDSDSETDLGSDTDIEDILKTDTHSPNKMSLKKTGKEFNFPNSDSDTDIEINENHVGPFGSPINTVREEQDSDIIPCTQLSDDDVDDFNFGIEKNSTMVEKNCMEDVSENFSLRLSAYTQLSEDLGKQFKNNTKENDASVLQNHSNVCTNINKNKLQIIEEIQPIAAKSTSEPALVSDNLFAQPTQKINSDSNDIESLFIQPTRPIHFQNDSGCALEPPVQASSSSSKHLFDPSAQPLALDEKCDDDLFLQPTQKIVVSHEKCDDDLFLQPTQKVVVSDEKCDDDLFLQPTQKVVSNEKCDDDLFLQPTQKVVVSDEKCDDDLFLQPTQKVVSNEKCDDDLFLQPTQKIVVSDEKCDDDLFLQPTQKVVVSDDDLFMQKTIQQKIIQTSKEAEHLFTCPTRPAEKTLRSENVFDQPTQPLDPNEKYDDDLFLQPTQKIVENSKDESNQNVFDCPTQPINIDCDDFFLQPTQKVVSTSEKKEDHDLFDQPTQVITAEENLDDDLFLQPTQQIRSPNEVALKSKSPLKPTDNSEKAASVESQLEVMFASQPFLPQSNSRPSNPLVSILEGNYRVDSQDPVSGNMPASEPLEVCDVDHNEVIVKEKLFPKQDQVTIKIKLRSSETVVVKENVTVDNKKNVTSKEESQIKSNKQLRSTRKPSLDDAQVDNDNISSRRSKRIKSVKIDEQIEQEVKESKQSKNEKEDYAGGSSKQTATSKQSKEDKNEITETKSIEMEKQNVLEKKANITKDGKASEESKLVVETKISTRKRTTRSDSVDSLNKEKATAKKNKIDDKSETGDQTDTVNNRRRLRNLKKDAHELNKIEENVTNTVKKSSRAINTENIAGTSTEIDLVKSSKGGKTRSETKKCAVVAVTRSTRGSKRNLISEQPLPDANDTIKTISSDSDDEIVLNKPRIIKRKQEIQTPSSSNKRIKNSVDTSPKSTPIAKKRTRLLHKIDTVDEPIEQKISNVSDTNSSNRSLQTPTTSPRLSNASSFSDTPNRNKRKQKPKVVFTMLDSPELESLIRSLGGIIVDTVNACTVLVTGSLKRSQKLLSAVGQGKPICSVIWLQECKKRSTFLDPWDFILEDKEAETKWNFSLKESLIRSQNKKLLENYVVHILATTAVDVLKAAVESCGGKCVTRAPKDTKNFIVVASPENKGKYSKFIKQKVTIVAPEAIFDGVLRQELHLKDHLLS